MWIRRERRLWMLLIGLTILLSGGPVWAQAASNNG